MCVDGVWMARNYIFIHRYIHTYRYIYTSVYLPISGPCGIGAAVGSGKRSGGGAGGCGRGTMVWFGLARYGELSPTASPRLASSRLASR